MVEKTILKGNREKGHIKSIGTKTRMTANLSGSKASEKTVDQRLKGGKNSHLEFYTQSTINDV